MAMRLEELDFSYPEALVATEPQQPFRSVLSTPTRDLELKSSDIFDLFQPGDVLVVNDTRVQKSRVFSTMGLEILFLRSLDHGLTWEVLFPASRVSDDEVIGLPGGVEMRLQERGLPQIVRVDRELTEDYFAKYGELALPPYIQKARGERHMRARDEQWYQTAWAENVGSRAAPTASLHFSNADLQTWRERGVIIAPITLHVGIGTFLPIKTATLAAHKMHREWTCLPRTTVETLQSAKADGRRVTALGTTVTRALESWAYGKLERVQDDFIGETDLFIQPGFEFKVVDRLMTNFHQPRSTLLALVSAFAGLERVRRTYAWAIARQFRLFSYGDLSIWQNF